MKEKIYNYDNINEKDINNYIDRAKMIVENDQEELLFASTNNNYYLIGGHVGDGESFDECVVREIEEEAGVKIPIEKRTPFFSIKYYCKDYPKEGLNTRYITNYYSIKYNLVPNLDKVNLTEGELNGGFKLEYIKKDKAIDVLTESLKTCTKEVVVRDTIDAVNIYLEK